MAKLLATALAVAVIGCTVLPVVAARAAKVQQGIFAYSNRQQTSQILGATGVPAYVSSSTGSRRGFYIMSVGSGGNWRRMHLQPGDLLISVDNQAITSAPQADSVLNGMTTGTRNVIFARIDEDGQPQFLTTKAAISASDSAQIANPDKLRTTSSQPRQRESTEALESYALELLNADRARNGKLPALRVHPTLAALAKYYAQYQVEHKIFEHVDDQGRDPMVRAKQHGVKAGVYENLAFQQYGWGSERDMINAAEKSMMNEPEGQMNHRGNILGPNRQYVGIGVYTDGHELMLVQEFTDSDP